LRVLKTLKFITRHPLTREQPLSALARFARWQAESRIKDEVTFEWIEGAKPIAKNGMTGATGNIYCGLHEFADMAFLLHFCRPGDLFVDVGANIGSYTVLASAVCGAHTIALEPDPVTMAALRKNISVNGLDQKVDAIEAAAGSSQGEVSFTTGRDTMNQVAHAGDDSARKVRVLRLDDLLAGKSPAFIKLDVEGYEAEVLGGAIETLQNPSLVAIETECRDAEVLAHLKEAGFKEYAYEPFSRNLSEKAGGSSNALYLRGLAGVLERVNAAPRRRVLHVML
jgi:FkbM family methyltransferase